MCTKKVSVVFIIVLSSIIITTSSIRAEFPIFAPINPTFLGGNPLNGPFLLNKAITTNEFNNVNDGKDSTSPDLSPLIGALNRMGERLAQDLGGNLSVSSPSLFQGGNNNFGIMFSFPSPPRGNAGQNTGQ
ncbi:MAG TPA: curli assembly protein CsgF [Candidatus Hypogeohydataceae bacterium YC41]